MFSINQQECRMHFDSNTKKDDQPSATLQFTYRTSNDVLSEFSPDLKSSSTAGRGKTKVIWPTTQTPALTTLAICRA